MTKKKYMKKEDLERYNEVVKYANKAIKRSGQFWQESFTYYMDEAEKIWSKYNPNKE